VLKLKVVTVVGPPAAAKSMGDGDGDGHGEESGQRSNAEKKDDVVRGHGLLGGEKWMIRSDDDPIIPGDSILQYRSMQG